MNYFLKRYFSPILITLFMSNGLIAQNNQITAYSLEEGLPQSQIYEIVQDDLGYIWLGTQGGGIAKFDGKDGSKAYVAVDGVVYDVSKSSKWKGGKHYRGIQAGRDLSDKIKRSPHGKSVLGKLKPMGTPKGVKK